MYAFAPLNYQKYPHQESQLGDQLLINLFTLSKPLIQLKHAIQAAVLALVLYFAPLVMLSIIATAATASMQVCPNILLIST